MFLIANFKQTLTELLVSLQYVSVSVSVLTLTAISVERFFAICEPMKFNGTKKRARCIIGIIWLVAVAISAPELHDFSVQPLSHVDTIFLTVCLPTWHPNGRLAYQAFHTLVLYVLPLTLMGYTYARIAIVLSSNSIPTENSSCSCQCLPSS